MSSILTIEYREDTFIKKDIRWMTSIFFSVVLSVLFIFLTLSSYHACSNEPQAFKTLHSIGDIKKSFVSNGVNINKFSPGSLIDVSFLEYFDSIKQSIMEKRSIMSVWSSRGELMSENGDSVDGGRIVDYTTYCSGTGSNQICTAIQVNSKNNTILSYVGNGQSLILHNGSLLMLLNGEEFISSTVIKEQESFYNAKKIISSSDLRYLVIYFDYGKSEVFSIFERNEENEYNKRIPNKDFAFKDNDDDDSIIGNNYKPNLCKREDYASISNNGVLACKSGKSKIFISTSNGQEYKINPMSFLGVVGSVSVTNDDFVVAVYKNYIRHNLAVWKILDPNVKFIYFQKFNVDHANSDGQDTLFTKMYPDKAMVLLADNANNNVVIKDLRKLYMIDKSEDERKDICFSDKTIPTKLYVKDAFFSSSKRNIVAIYGEGANNKNSIELWKVGCGNRSATLLDSINVKNDVNHVKFNSNATEMVVSFRVRAELYKISSYDGDNVFDEFRRIDKKENSLLKRIIKFNKHKMKLMEDIYELKDD